MTREQLVLKLQQEYAQRREENARLYEERVAEACERCPGLRELLTARHAALMAGVRGALYPKQKDPNANAALSRALGEYGEKIAALMAKNGVDRALIAPVYTCEACKDEGYLYDPSRRMCACFERELNRRLLEELGLENGHTFERFDESLFTDDAPVAPAVGANVTQRVWMRRVRAICESYAEQFPDTQTRDMLFTGRSGLGKTFLLQAIAQRVAARGFSPLYVSAYQWLETSRRAYFGNDPELTRPMMGAPLLLIDDLGTEPLMENITVTQLFNLLNERQNAGRHTVISTNLSISELKSRYTERISSRLLDSSRCQVVRFLGGDVRERLGASR